MDIALLLVVILVVVFVWRGPKTLPQLGRMFGEGLRSARREMGGSDDRPDGSGPRAS